MEEEKPLENVKRENEIKLFGKYSFDGVTVNDLGLKNIISLKPVIVPKTSGRLSQQRLARERMSIVERLISHLMVPGHRGKKHLRTSKLMSGRFNTASNLVESAFDMISKDGLNPLQVLVKAIENSAPKEEVMTLLIGGQRLAKQVDTAPIRRVDLALRWIAEGTYQLSATGKKADRALYEILTQAANNQDIAFPISKRIDTERQAASSR
ncbi:MAG: 30S ribosomal protein S7 [Candidatus Parvarchaeum sp.]|nr:30S ribosomal protein S7 [Candidatus Parvarchaeum tengchongense]MCW1295139.1 30S ribosomal protein S7 [Candidatus Parvarchaeum tengchongense]MCW1299589.1 30S ribosomal protein S7 [Candidatus Parvarchaeum tengchongense]